VHVDSVASAWYVALLSLFTSHKEVPLVEIWYVSWLIAFALITLSLSGLHFNEKPYGRVAIS